MHPLEVFHVHSRFPKQRYMIETPMHNIIGRYRENAHWLSNEYPIGRSERSEITIHKLGHWIWDRNTNMCYRLCRTDHRFEQLTDKLKSLNIRYKTKPFFS